jgi:hypothetical protein
MTTYQGCREPLNILEVSYDNDIGCGEHHL